MTEEYARLMLKEIDEARNIISNIKELKTRNQISLGKRIVTNWGEQIAGVFVPESLKIEFLIKVEGYAKTTLSKYGIDE